MSNLPRRTGRASAALGVLEKHALLLSDEGRKPLARQDAAARAGKTLPYSTGVALLKSLGRQEALARLAHVGGYPAEGVREQVAEVYASLALEHTAQWRAVAKEIQEARVLWAQDPLPL